MLKNIIHLWLLPTTSEIIFRIYVEKPYLEVCKYEFENILEDNIKWKEY